MFLQIVPLLYKQPKSATKCTNGWSMNHGKSFEMVDVIGSPLSPPEVNSFQVRYESEESYARDSQDGSLEILNADCIPLNVGWRI